MTRAIATLALSAILALSLPARTGVSAFPAYDAATVPIYVQWLRVDPQHPHTLFVGGRFWCQYGGVTQPACLPFIMRSTDGGLRWTDLRPALARLTIGPGGPFLSDPSVDYEVTPIVIAADGRYVYMDVTAFGSPSSNAAYVLRSLDAGLHWQAIPTHGWIGLGGCGSGLQDVTLSPVTPGRLYVETVGMGGVCGGVARSDDAGRTLHDVANPSTIVFCYGGCRSWGALVTDPTRPKTVYANVTNYAPIVNPPVPAYAARSDDAGLHWSVVMTPTASPPLQTFIVGTDPHEGALLVGQTRDKGVPATRRYLSADEGRTWRVASCPGDLHGTCPAFSVDNVFGAGAAYGFVNNGLYRFHGGGPAVARLALSARLPFATAALIDVGAGQQAGAPLYLLVNAVRGSIHGALYRSTDGGHTWRRLLAGPFPLSCSAC